MIVERYLDAKYYRYDPEGIYELTDYNVHAMDTLLLGRANTEVGIGDLVELLLSISFACKDALLDWKA